MGLCACMTEKPTYEELEQRVKALENDLARYRELGRGVNVREQYLEAILDNTNMPIYLKDSDYRYLLVNREYERVLNLTCDQALGRTDYDIFPEPLADLFRSQDEEVKQRRALVEFIETIALPGGDQTFLTTKFPLINEQGEVYAIGGLCTDISELQQVQRNLQESEKKFRRVVESCPQGMMMFRLDPDEQLIFIGANPAADQILGVECAEFVGRTIEEAFPPLIRTEIPAQCREVCRTGNPWKAEQFHYEDKRISGAYEIQAFQTEPGRMAMFFADITRKKRMEKEIRNIQKLESVGILAGGIAHDFNNLLTVILGNISMARIFSETGKNCTDRLKDAEKATLRARDLTQQLLTFAKGGAPIKTSGSVRELVKDSASFMLSGSNVTHEIIAPDELWPVEMDEGQISQVIQNVVKNGEQAMPDGGTITIRMENVSVAADDPVPLPAGRYVRISISDQGVGIIPKHLAKVFDPYFSTKQEGSGLGLAASYSIVKNHDGLITVESTPASGTTFHVYLPASGKKPVPKKKTQQKLQRSGEKILVMDDDPDVLAVAENMLNLMGYKTGTASDGTEAVQLFTKARQEGQPFDGIILDLTIPGGMGGLETMKQLSRLDPEVKAVVSSGYANDPVMADFEEHGFSGVIAKPYTMEKLGGVLRQLFG